MLEDAIIERIIFSKSDKFDGMPSVSKLCDIRRFLERIRCKYDYDANSRVITIRNDNTNEDLEITESLFTKNSLTDSETTKISSFETTVKETTDDLSKNSETTEISSFETTIKETTDDLSKSIYEENTTNLTTSLSTPNNKNYELDINYNEIQNMTNPYDIDIDRTTSLYSNFENLRNISFSPRKVIFSKNNISAKENETLINNSTLISFCLGFLLFGIFALIYFFINKYWKSKKSQKKNKNKKTNKYYLNETKNCENVSIEMMELTQSRN